MDRSSNSVKIEKIRRALETKNYDSALAIAKTVDSARIKSAADLSVVAEAYDKNGIYDTALVYYEQIYLKSKTRRILIHLINLCLKLSMADMAELYLRDFSEMAPRDFYRHIFRYHIDKLRGEEMEVLIYDLEQLKAENFMEDWAYELAKLYHRNGQSEECIAECNDIILWFGSGMYVDRARGLRAIHLSRLGRGGGTSEAGIAKEVRRLVEEGKGVQELEEFIEEVTIPEGNTHYSEEEYNQERFGKPVYEEEGKDVIWNTREFGAITDEMIQQQNTMDLLRGMQVAEQLRMQLGAGFENQYTGKENVFLYGAMLGYKREFLKEKYEEIVAFSELGDFINVLSVGDAKFRKKSEKKIKDMFDKGITVLFVSHSIGQVRSLCDRAIILEKGRMIAQGDVATVSALYEEAIK